MENKDNTNNQDNTNNIDNNNNKPNDNKYISSNLENFIKANQDIKQEENNISEIPIDINDNKHVFDNQLNINTQLDNIKSNQDIYKNSQLSDQHNMPSNIISPSSQNDLLKQLEILSFDKQNENKTYNIIPQPNHQKTSSVDVNIYAANKSINQPIDKDIFDVKFNELYQKIKKNKVIKQKRNYIIDRLCQSELKKTDINMVTPSNVIIKDYNTYKATSSNKLVSNFINNTKLSNNTLRSQYSYKKDPNKKQKDKNINLNIIKTNLVNNIKKEKAENDSYLNTFLNNRKNKKNNFNKKYYINELNSFKEKLFKEKIDIFAEDKLKKIKK